MDGQRFDDLAKALASNSSRRAIFKALAGGALGGALVLTRVGTGAARCRKVLDDRCNKPTDCCPDDHLICVDRRCGCEPGWAHCTDDPLEGCETPLGTIADCAGCGEACGPYSQATPACAAGLCGIAACDPGFADCNGVVEDGCEVDLLTDLANCGGCGIDFTALPNVAAAACVDGAVAISACAPDFDNCDGDPTTGCEAHLPSDPLHCGSCDAPCPGGKVCEAGGCVCPPTDCLGGRVLNPDTCACECPPEQEVCNDACIDTAANPDHCGGCNAICRSTTCVDAVCSGGECERTPIEGCCTAAADCDDGNPCTTDACNLATNMCERTALDGDEACEVDGAAGVCRAGACLPDPVVACPDCGTCQACDVDTAAGTLVCGAPCADPCAAGTLCARARVDAAHRALRRALRDEGYGEGAEPHALVLREDGAITRSVLEAVYPHPSRAGETASLVYGEEAAGGSWSYVLVFQAGVLSHALAVGGDGQVERVEAVAGAVTSGVGAKRAMPAALVLASVFENSCFRCTTACNINALGHACSPSAALACGPDVRGCAVPVAGTCGNTTPSCSDVCDAQGFCEPCEPRICTDPMTFNRDSCVCACPPDRCCEDVDCDDGNSCTDDRCNAATGQCSNPFKVDGTPCEGDGVCQDGNCASFAGIGWPFDPRDGLWAIVSGYHNSGETHRDASIGTAFSALDFAKCPTANVQEDEGMCDPLTGWRDITGPRDGQAGADVHAPVRGVIDYGQHECRGLGISVDGAPNYQVLLYHVEPSQALLQALEARSGDTIAINTWDDVAAWRDPVTGQRYHVAKGDLIGTVSSVACAGIGDHIHMELRRKAGDSSGEPGPVPFDDTWAIDGCEYGDDGTSDQHEGKLVPCCQGGQCVLSTCTAENAFVCSGAFFVNCGTPGPNDDFCVCELTTEGDPVCAGITSTINSCQVQPCQSSSECPSGQTCGGGGCCGLGPVCRPACGTSIATSVATIAGAGTGSYLGPTSEPTVEADIRT